MGAFLRYFSLVLLTGLLSATSGGAATVTMNADDATGTSSFNTAGTWSSGAAPSGSNDYVDTGHALRTPTTSGSLTFAGNSLSLLSGATLAYKGGGSSDVITIGSLIVGGGSTISNWTGTTIAFTLAGNINLTTGGAHFDVNANDPILVTAAISGVGGLQITAISAVSQSTGAIVLKGANTYQGGTILTANSYLDVQADGALGTGNVTVSAGDLKFELGTSNNYIADSASLILSSSLSSGAINLAFTGSDTVAGLSLNGGTTYVSAGTWGAVGSGAQFTSSLFTGTGTLTVVPEVRTGALFLGGGILLIVLRWRRNQSGYFRLA